MCDFTVCYYLLPGYTQSRKDSHETLAHHPTVTKLAHIFKQAPIVSYRKEKSLKNIFVRAKLPLITPQSYKQRSTFKGLFSN